MDPEAYLQELGLFQMMMTNAHSVDITALSCVYGHMQTPSQRLPASRQIDAEWIPPFEPRTRSKQLKKLLPDVPASFTQQLRQQMASLTLLRSSVSPVDKLTEPISNELTKAIQMYVEERLKVCLDPHSSQSWLKFPSAGLLTTLGR